MQSSKTTLLLAAVAGSVLVGIGASPALSQAIDFDAGRDLLASEKPDDATDTQNPNPVVPQWSYGYRATAGGTGLTLFTAADHIVNGTVEGFADAAGGCCGPLPSVGVNTGPAAAFPAGTIATGEMLLHPDGNAAGNFADEAKSVVRFTASTAGQYAVTALFEDTDDCCGVGTPNGANNSPGVDVHVVVNGTSIFDDAISREAGANDPANLPTFTSFSAPSVTLAAGDVVDFVVGTNGQLFGDATRFNATLDLIPEPSGLALLALGGMGLAARRRR
jgi:hypothetical protein